MDPELDTGATVSVISTQTKAQMFPQSTLMDCTLTLTTYTGELLEVAGQILIEVKHGRQVKQLPLYVVKGNGPVVPEPKLQGNIRLCGDYKVTINPQLEVDQYPLPKPDNIFATLSGGKWFSKIDLKHAYQQIKLSESSRPLVTINTHRGLYQYTRLPFGVASATESDGHCSARSVKSDLLLRQYFDNRKLPTRIF